jgi:hypothetical protein
MTLKWHHKNISNKITIFIEFWQLLEVFFGSFDYDYTHRAILCVYSTKKLDNTIIIGIKLLLHKA